MKMLNKILLIALLLSAELAFALSPDDFVHQTSQKVMAVLETNESASAKEQSLTTVFVDTIDIEWIAKFVLGKSWNSLNDSQKSEYLAAYKSYLIQSYVPLFKKYNHQKITIKSSQPIENNNYLITTEIVSDDKTIRIDYRLAAVGDTFKVHDIVAEGVGLLQTQRSDFNAIISNQGFPGLIKILHDKAHPQG
jgi:phospholipid transport system substrate-binding protein